MWAWSVGVVGGVVRVQGMLLRLQRAHWQLRIGCCSLQQLATAYCSPKKTFSSPLVLGYSSLHHSSFPLHQSSSWTYYDVLGVPRDATKQEIKTAFFKLSKQLHPDVKQDLPQEPDTKHKRTFVEVNEAYSILVDPTKRTQYDLQLKTIEEYTAQHQAYRQSYGRQGPESMFYGYPYSGYNRTDAYTFTRRDYGFPQTHRGTVRGSHAKVILSLIVMMLLASAVHTFRINSAHKNYQRKSQSESARNNQIYSQVRERARNTSLQEQLEALSQRHAETLATLAASEKSK